MATQTDSSDKEIATLLIDDYIQDLRERCFAIFDELQQRGTFVVRADLTPGDDAAGDYIARLFVFLSAMRDYPNAWLRTEKDVQELKDAAQMALDLALSNIDAMVRTVGTMPQGNA